MLLSTKGIVLHCMDYSETSIIARVYTEQLGLQSYMVKGARKKGANIRRNLFSPLSILNLVANHKEGEGLRTLREASVVYHLNEIAIDISKTTISIFMGELLSRCISAQMPDKNLYAFIENFILQLENQQQHIGGIPLTFTLKLSQILGLEPHNNYSQQNTFFDLMEGHFCQQPPPHPYFIAAPLTASLSENLSALQAGVETLQTPYTTRQAQLSALMDYFRIHIPTFGEMKSIQVLNTVLT